MESAKFLNEAILVPDDLKFEATFSNLFLSRWNNTEEAFALLAWQPKV